MVWGKYLYNRNYSEFIQDMANRQAFSSDKALWSRTGKVMERALSGLILNLHYYNGRILLYPISLRESVQWATIPDSKNIAELLFFRLSDRWNWKLSRKLQDEILPQVARMKPRIEEKLDLENILPKDKNEEKNPGLVRNVQRFGGDIQNYGGTDKTPDGRADVYMSAFANMNTLIFLRTSRTGLSHSIWPWNCWRDLQGWNTRSGTNELAEALYKTPFICNSDKYSLLLNLKHLPSSQKSMMLKVFRMELEGFSN